MVAALERGLPLDYTINAISPYPTKYPVDRGSDAGCPGTQFYCPVNANPGSMNGINNMWRGFGRSVNTYWVPLQERIGAENAVDVAKRLGIKFRAHGTPQNPADYEFANNPQLAHSWGPFTLGVTAVTPLELANAYATLAADGTFCEPTPVIEIKGLDGSKLDAANPHCSKDPVVAPDVARAAVDAARCPLGDQSVFGKCEGGTASYVKGIVGRQVAGKTGTTDHDWTATTVAMTLRDGMAGKPNVIPFTAPSRDIAFGKRVGIPDVKCQPIDAAKAKLKAAGFEVDVAPTPVP